MNLTHITLNEADTKDLEVLIDLVLGDYATTLVESAADMTKNGELDMATDQIKNAKAIVRACYKLGYAAGLRPEMADIDRLHSKFNV